MSHRDLHLPEATHNASPLTPPGTPRAEQPKKTEVKKLDANDPLVQRGRELLSKKAAVSGTTQEAMGDVSELKGILPEHFSSVTEEDRSFLNSIAPGTPKVTRLLTMRERIEGVSELPLSAE